MKLKKTIKLLLITVSGGVIGYVIIPLSYFISGLVKWSPSLSLDGLLQIVLAIITISIVFYYEYRGPKVDVRFRYLSGRVLMDLRTKNDILTNDGDIVIEAYCKSDNCLKFSDNNDWEDISLGKDEQGYLKYVLKYKSPNEFRISGKNNEITIMSGHVSSDNWHQKKSGCDYIVFKFRGRVQKKWDMSEDDDYEKDLCPSSKK